MVKVIFTDGSEMNFHGKSVVSVGDVLHIIQNEEIYQPVMVPVAHVKVCGVWDKEKGEFA